MSNVPRSPKGDPAHISHDSSSTILSMLTELSESNRALLSRIEKVKQRQSVAGDNR